MLAFVSRVLVDEESVFSFTCVESIDDPEVIIGTVSLSPPPVIIFETLGVHIPVGGVFVSPPGNCLSF